MLRRRSRLSPVTGVDAASKHRGLREFLFFIWRRKRRGDIESQSIYSTDLEKSYSPNASRVATQSLPPYSYIARSRRVTGNDHQSAVQDPGSTAPPEATTADETSPPAPLDATTTDETSSSTPLGATTANETSPPAPLDSTNRDDNSSPVPLDAATRDDTSSPIPPDAANTTEPALPAPNALLNPGNTVADVSLSENISTDPSSSLGASSHVATSTSLQPETAALSSTVSPTESRPSLLTYQSQGVFLQPHVDGECGKIFTEEFKPRIKIELARICRRNSWMLEFSMAGGCPDRLTPAIIVWCKEPDTKTLVQKYFDNDTWCKDRMQSHGMGCYVLERPPCRCATEVSTNCLNLCTIEGSCLVISNDAMTPCGLDLILIGGQKSKVGGLITIDEVPYLHTTRHGLGELLRASNDHPPISGTTMDNGKALSILDTLRVVDVTSLPKSDLNGSPDLGLPPERSTYMVTILYPSMSIDDQVSTEPPVEDFDWALVNLSQAPSALLDRVLRVNMDQGQEIQGLHTGEIKPSTSVTLTVGGQVISGLLSNIYSTLLVEESVYEVLLITTEKLLPPGVSGTWVLIDDCVCGFVVAAREDLPWAYMLPMQDAFKNMEAVLSTTNIRITAASEIEEFRNRFVSSASREDLNASDIASAFYDPGTDLESAIIKFEGPSTLLTSKKSQDSPAGSNDHRGLKAFRHGASNLLNKFRRESTKSNPAYLSTQAYRENDDFSVLSESTDPPHACTMRIYRPDDPKGLVRKWFPVSINSGSRRCVTFLRVIAKLGWDPKWKQGWQHLARIDPKSFRTDSGQTYAIIGMVYLHISLGKELKRRRQKFYVLRDPEDGNLPFEFLLGRKWIQNAPEGVGSGFLVG